MFVRPKDPWPRSASPALLMGSVLAPLTSLGMLVTHTFSQSRPVTTEQWVGTGMLLAVAAVIVGYAGLAAYALRRQAGHTRR